MIYKLQFQKCELNVFLSSGDGWAAGTTETGVNSYEWMILSKTGAKKGAVKKVPLKSRLCRKVQPAKIFYRETAGSVEEPAV